MTDDLDTPGDPLDPDAEELPSTDPITEDDPNAPHEAAEEK